MKRQPQHCLAVTLTYGNRPSPGLILLSYSQPLISVENTISQRHSFIPLVHNPRSLEYGIKYFKCPSLNECPSLTLSIPYPPQAPVSMILANPAGWSTFYLSSPLLRFAFSTRFYYTLQEALLTSSGCVRFQCNLTLYQVTEYHRMITSRSSEFLTLLQGAHGQRL